MDFKGYITDKLVSFTELDKDTVSNALETPPDEKLGEMKTVADLWNCLSELAA